MLPRPLRPPPYPPRPGCGGFFASCGKRGRPRAASVLAALLLAASQAPAGQPPGILIAGNSYSYYNCGVDEVLRGLMRETRPRLRSEVTLEAVSGGAVAAHPLPQLLRPRGARARSRCSAGTYLYGALLYSSLFGRSTEGLAYRGGCEKPLEPALARFLQGCAWKAVTDFSAGQDGQKER